MRGKNGGFVPWLICAFVSFRSRVASILHFRTSSKDLAFQLVSLS